jgi:hypothetical protein
MPSAIPPDLKPAIRAEVERILSQLEAAGWTVNRIEWESAPIQERRISFSAKSETGKQFYSTCPEEYLPERLSNVLRSTNI